MARKSVPEQLSARRTTFYITTLASLVALTISSLVTQGGRQTFVLLLLAFLIATYLRGTGRFKISVPKLLAGVLLSSVAFFFATSWLMERQGLDFNAEAALFLTHRATYHTLVERVARADEATALMLLSLSYFASPITTLSYYMQQPDLPGPLWGAYSYPLPMRMIGRLLGDYDPNAWITARRLVFAPLESGGGFANVWPTWLRDLYVDFGWLGALVYLSLFSAFMAWARNRFEKNGYMEFHHLEVLAAMTAAFGAFQNTLAFATTAYAFFIALLMLLIRRLKFRSEPRILRI
jgi:hypothetical protein